MSGGEFNYKQLHIESLIEDVDIILNDGCKDYLKEETYNKIKETKLTLQKAFIMVQRLDYLVSCDDGEDSFNCRWDAQLLSLTEGE